MIKLQSAKGENILCWCGNPEQGAIDQAMNIAKHPCLVGNVCLMPDTHQGYGMPIGGVAAFDAAICPNMVGVDIGCGMLSVKTNIRADELSRESLQEITDKIKASVPVGFNWHPVPQKHEIFENGFIWGTLPVCKTQYERAQLQIGTLGSGNHFIEIQRGDDGFVYFMIHSGSRNLGKQVADHYNKEAIRLCAMFHNDDVIKNELAYLPIGTKEAENYINEMNMCLDFSNANRDYMAHLIESCIRGIVPSVEFGERINIQHNYARLEHHYGRNVWVHRKGATSARDGEIGLIPGSQGTSSYIVRGLGNKASLMSCSHGAGRKIGRKKAQEILSVESECALLDKQGIIHSIKSKDDLDEAPSAYKDIDVVMDEQKDLVEILVKLSPMAVIKG